MSSAATGSTCGRRSTGLWLSPRDEAATQAFRLDVDPELPFVRADPSLLDQALANIVGNAVRYAGPEAEVELAARREGGEIVLSMTDDGPGISPTLLPKVFEKFARGREQDGDGGEGTGLGLAIAKGIVEAHGGSIAAESPVARWARHPHRDPVAPGGAEPMTHPTRVLVIDDEPAIHRFLKAGPRGERLRGHQRRHRRRGLEAHRRAMHPTWSCSTSACLTWTART